MFPIAPPVTRILNHPGMSRVPNQAKEISKLPNVLTTRLENPVRSIFQQPNLATRPTRCVMPLINSRLHRALPDRIQKERRAHTMAPISRISGPIPTLKANMFATTIVPSDNQIDPSSKIDYENLDDSNAPIVVKVRYDPQSGGKPSEDAVRHAIGQQLFDRRGRKDPIIVNFVPPNIPIQMPNRIQQNPLPTTAISQTSRFAPPLPHPSVRPLRHKNDHSVQTAQPFINQSRALPLRKTRLAHQNRNPTRVQSKELQTSDHRMATQQQSPAINNTQFLSTRANLAPSSGDVFRPPSVNDIPELSRDNLLSMLNQIPDLQGRRFNIEYAPPTAPEGYPIPWNIDTSNNTYPEPVIIDQLPSNVIQHVKSSNNPALTAALEATIRQEQSHSTVPSLHVPPSTMMHHTAQSSQQVQQSRPVSSDESDSSSSSTDVSSSDTSSSEETDSEQSQPSKTLPFVGPMAPTMSS